MKTWIALFLVGVLMLQPGLAQDEDSAFSDSDFDLELPTDDLELDLDVTTPVVSRDWELSMVFFRLNWDDPFLKRMVVQLWQNLERL
jgi:hypothetical protein